MKEERKTERISELCRYVTAGSFEKAYIRFIEQADENAITKRSGGSRIPYGFSDKNEFDGARFTQHFGQGAASKTPYMSWWVISVYYIGGKRIVIGIEENRYPRLDRMKPLRYERIGNKKENIAVFYETDKDNANYGELYERFISVCEEVMSLGL